MLLARDSAREMTRWIPEVMLLVAGLDSVPVVKPGLADRAGIHIRLGMPANSVS